LDWEREDAGWGGDIASVMPMPLPLVFMRRGFVDELAERLNIEGMRVRPSELELWPSGGCNV